VAEAKANVVYAWRGSSGIGMSTTAQQVGETLAEIESRYGGIRPRVVLEEAKSTTHVFHSEFEWDNAVCGDKYRLDQARKLIASVFVVQVDEKRPTEPIRAFVNMRPTETSDQQYESVVRVLSDERKRGLLLQQAAAELRSWERRYANLDEFATVFSAIRQLEPV
jgi:hypothetical protein